MRGSTAGRVPPAGEGGGCTEAEGLRSGPVGLSEGRDDEEAQARCEQQELALSSVREGPGPRCQQGWLLLVLHGEQDLMQYL